MEGRLELIAGDTLTFFAMNASVIPTPFFGSLSQWLRYRNYYASLFLHKEVFNDNCFTQTTVCA